MRLLPNIVELSDVNTGIMSLEVVGNNNVDGTTAKIMNRDRNTAYANKFLLPFHMSRMFVLHI